MSTDSIALVADKLAQQLTPKMAELLLKSTALRKFVRDFNAYTTIKELSTFLDIPYATMQGWVATGKLPVFKVPGQDPKIYLKDLQIFVEECAEGQK